MAVERKLVDLEFLILRWSTENPHFCGVVGRFAPLSEDVIMLTSLPFFGKTHGIGLYPDGEDKKRIDFLTKSLKVEVLD